MYFQKQIHEAIIQVLDFVEYGNLWIVRSTQTIVALDSVSGVIQWQIELKDDHLLSFKPMIALETILVYASTHVEQQNNRAQIHGCNIKTGAELWSKDINWSVLNHLSGLHAHRSNLFLLDWKTSEQKNVVMRFLDPKTGRERHTFESVPVRPTAIETYGIKTCGATENNIYLGHLNDSVHQVVLDNANLCERLFDFGQFKQLATGSSTAYLSGWIQGENKIICVDETDNTISSTKMTVDPEALIALQTVDERNLVLAQFGPKQGATIIDFSAGATHWSFGQESDLYVINAVKIPQRVACLVSMGADNQILILDEISRTVDQVLEPLFINNWIGTSKGHLLVSTELGLIVYETD